MGHTIAYKSSLWAVRSQRENDRRSPSKGHSTAVGHKGLGCGLLGLTGQHHCPCEAGGAAELFCPQPVALISLNHANRDIKLSFCASFMTTDSFPGKPGWLPYGYMAKGSWRWDFQTWGSLPSLGWTILWFFKKILNLKEAFSWMIIARQSSQSY